MIADPMAEILDLTDALLNAARSPNPDLVYVATLLDDRQSCLDDMSASPSNSAQRLAVLRRVQAADSELRARLDERRRQVEDELSTLSRRGTRRSPASLRSHLVDRKV